MNDFIQAWFPVFAFILSAGAMGLGLYVHYVASVRVNLSAAEIYQRINRDYAAMISGGTAHSERLTRLEAAFDNLPRRDDLHHLSLQVKETSGDMKAMTSEMANLRDTLRAVQASVQRVNDHLLHGKNS